MKSLEAEIAVGNLRSRVTIAESLVHQMREETFKTKEPSRVVEDVKKSFVAPRLSTRLSVL